MDRAPKWRDAAPEIADRLGMVLEGSRSPQIVGPVDGFYTTIRVVPGGENAPPMTKFSVALPGWPSEAGLQLRWGRPRLFKRRYLSFGDPEFDRVVAVKATDTDLVLVHLDKRRRDAYLQAVRHIMDKDRVTIARKRTLIGSSGGWVTSRQALPRVRKGALETSFTGVVTIPDVAVETARRAVDLAATLNG